MVVDGCVPSAKYERNSDRGGQWAFKCTPCTDATDDIPLEDSVQQAPSPENMNTLILLTRETRILDELKSNLLNRKAHNSDFVTFAIPSLTTFHNVNSNHELWHQGAEFS